MYVERWLRKPERRKEREGGGREEEGVRESERTRERVETGGRESDLDGVRKPTGVEEDGNTSTESTLQALPLVHALPLAGVPT